MWILILVGGGIVVTLLGPITISGFGDLNWFIASVLKDIITIFLVVIWILILKKKLNPNFLSTVFVSCHILL